MPPENDLPSLGGSDENVQIWHADLDIGDSDLARLETMLDDAELVRARRFHFAKDRRHFTAARAILRALLGKYLGGMDAREVRFDYTPRGKPFVVTSAADAALKFNVSHSGGLALFVFAPGREVGVDLEAGERLRDDWASLAKRVFSERERAELMALPAELQREAFLNGWTRKEAFLKATGMGISDGLQRIEVSLDPARPARLLSAANDVRKWTLHDLRAHAGMAAALAVEGDQPLRVELFQCPPDFPFSAISTGEAGSWSNTMRRPPSGSDPA